MSFSRSCLWEHAHTSVSRKFRNRDVPPALTDRLVTPVLPDADGVFRTLEEVVDFYDAGGGGGLGLAVPNQTLPSDSLRLSRDEKHHLVAFLHALTDATSRTRTDLR